MRYFRSALAILTLGFVSILCSGAAHAVAVPLSQAVSTTVPSVPGDGISVEIFLGVGGGQAPDPSHIQGRTPNAALLSPRIDFPHPGDTVSISSDFQSFFSDTVVAPDSVRSLQPQNFILRCTALLKVTKSLDRDLSTAPIDIQIGHGSDDGHYLMVGNQFLGSSGDHGFSYYWYNLEFEGEGLYPIYELFAANSSGVSGLEISWNVASGQSIIPQSNLYTTVPTCTNSINFEEYPAGTILTDQYKPAGIKFNRTSGDLQVTNAQPTRFVPVSGDRVYGDPASPAANPGRAELTFVMPGTDQTAAVDYFSCYVINATTANPATLTAYDPNGNQVYTGSYSPGGAARQLVEITQPLMHRLVVTLGDGSNTSALDNVCFGTPYTDATSPETSITAGPAEGVTLCVANTSFTYVGSDNSTAVDKLIYAWRLDGGAWQGPALATTASLTGLSEGPHTFEVKAVDQFGNADPTPEVRHFTIDAIPTAVSGVASTPTDVECAITYTTDIPIVTQVAYGTTTSYGSLTPVETTASTSHAVTLTGLTPNTPYHYCVSYSDACGAPVTSPDQTFTTMVGPPVSWVDWTSGTSGSDGHASGVLTFGSTTVNVDYTGEIAFIQTSGGTNYWNPSGSYISTGCGNAPPASDIIALSQASSKTLTFSEAVSGLLFAVVSLNGNGYRFNRDFDILSYGCGFYGCGSLTKQDMGDGTYQLNGSGEPHGVIRFIGAATSITWTSLTNEYWNGFTVGTYGVILDTAPPDTQITSTTPAEGGTLCADSVTIQFSGVDDVTPTDQLKYQWRLDGGTWSAPSTQTSQDLESLGQGAHVFEVAAVDWKGGVDPTPAVRHFSVDTAAPVISGVVVTPSMTGCVITWTTDDPATSQVFYGGTSSYGQSTALDSALVTSHSRTITGLNPNTPYHFKAISDDTCAREDSTTDGVFTTLSDTTPPTVIITSAPNQGSLVCSLPIALAWTGSDNITPANGLVFSYRVNGAAWSDWAADTGTTLQALADGSVTFGVKSRDAAGNESASPASRTFTLDTSTPAILAVSAAPSIAQAAITWTTSKPATSQVDYGLTDAYGSSSALNSSSVTSHSAVLNGLTPGSTYHYRVRSTDACGREAVSGDFTFVPLADTTAPDTQIVSGPQEASKSCSGSVNMCWSGTDNYVQASALAYSWKVDDQDWTSFGPDTCHQFDGLADGSHTISVKAQDPSGNIDQTPAVRHFAVDLNPPAFSNVSANASQIQATISWLTDADSTSQVEYGQTDSYGSLTTVDSRFVSIHNVAVTGLDTNTTYHYRMRSTDGCGREAISGDYTFTTGADAAPPETQITSGPAEGSTICSGTAELIYTGTDDTTPANKLKYEWRVDGGTWSSFTTAVATTLSNLGEGAHSFEVAAQDAFGKLDPTPAIRHFTVKINPPVISSIVVTPSQTQATIAWATDQPASSQIDYGSTTAYGAQTPANTSLVTSHSVAVSGLSPNSPYHFRIHSVDSCGREVISSDGTFTTLVDSGAPEAYISAGPGEGGLSCSTTVSISWSGHDDATPTEKLVYSWRIDSTTWSEFNGETSHVFTGLSETSHIFYVRAKDTSGNVSAMPAIRHFTVDLSAPTVSSVSAVPLAGQATITWQSSKPATSIVYYGATSAYGSATSLDQNLVASHSVTIAGLTPETTYHFSVESKDACDRKVGSGDLSFATTADNNMPNTTIVSGPVEDGKACGPTVTLCWTGTDDSTPAAQLQYSYKMDSADWSDWALDTCHEFTGLADGLHTLSVKAKDTSGNADGTPAVRNFKVDTTPPTISNILYAPRPSSITVSWLTNEPTTSQVEYGPTAGYGSATGVDGNVVTSHKLTITGLTPETSYHIRVRSSDGCNEVVSDDQTVTTTAVVPPDLVPQSLAPPMSASSGQEIQVGWAVQDIEPGDAVGNWMDGFYLSEKDTFDSTAIPLGQYSRSGGLSGMFAYSNTQNLTMPIVAPGLHYLILRVDDSGVIHETNEDNNFIAQAINFTMPKQLVISPDLIQQVLNVGVAFTGQLDISNMGTTPLTNISVTVEGAAANMDVKIDAPTSIEHLTAKKISFTITANDESVLQNTLTAHFKSAEGPEAAVSFSLYVTPRQPRLEANPGHFDTSMIRGRQTLVDCEITNTGAVAANDMKVTLPDVPWMSLVSPQTISTLGTGEKTKVSILLKPDSSLPLGPYTGNLAVAGSNGGVSVNFRFNAISDLLGDLKVTATDEFSFFADDHPNVTDATVTLKDAVDNHVVFEAMTGETGVVLKQGLPEGHYNLEVTSYKHASDQEPVEIVAGQVKEVKAFLHRQMVTYSWNVEPVQIEDKYKITLEAVFETHVPAPVVTVDPPFQLVPVLEGRTTEIDYTITNHGLIAAQGVNIDFGDSSDFYIIPLIRDIGVLAPESSIVVPVMVRAKSDGPIEGLPTVATDTSAAKAAAAAAAARGFQPQGVARLMDGGGSGKPCDLVIQGKVLYYYVCIGNVPVAIPINTTPFKVGKEIYDIIKCGLDLAACAGGMASAEVGGGAVAAAKCPDAVRCLFKYTCEIISANLGTPCCFCKMVSALLGDTGEMGDAFGCLPKSQPSTSKPTTVDGGGIGLSLNLPSNGFSVNVTPWDFGSGVPGNCKPGFGPAPAGTSSASSSKPASNTPSQTKSDISKYGGKEVRYMFRCY